MGRAEVRTTVRYRDLFRDRQYSALFVADLLSRLGSQLGKFALAGLVYARTGSTSYTAATFAVTFLPGLLGGPLLASLADRLPRRPLLIGCDLVRAVLVVAIAVGGFSIVASLALLFLVELAKAPFSAARIAMLADILDSDRFAAGNAVVGASQQAVQVAGFGAGGFIVLALGAQSTLLIDAATYLLSALILLTVVRSPARPVRPPGGGRPRLLADLAEGINTIRDSPVLPPLFWLLFIGSAVLITGEALAIPYADQLGVGSQVAGLFLAGAPLGTMVGLALVGRLDVATRRRLLIPFCLFVGVFTAACGVVRHPYAVIGCLVLAGLAMGHMAHLQASIIDAIEPYMRGRVIGLANTVLQIAQATSILLAGIVADTTSIRLVFLGSGAAGVLCVAALALLRSPNVGKHRASARRQRAGGPRTETVTPVRALDGTDWVGRADRTADPRDHQVTTHLASTRHAST